MNGALERTWKEMSELFWDVSKNLSGRNEHFSKHTLPSDRDSKLELLSYRTGTLSSRHTFW